MDTRFAPCTIVAALAIGMVASPLRGDAAEAQAEDKEQRRARERQEADEFFGTVPYVRIKIDVSAAGVRELRRYHWFANAPDEIRPEVRATVYEGGHVYTNVALHLKGSAGSFRPVDDEPAFTLNFDKFAEGQTFHGLDKISLNNSVQDSSYLAEKISREMFNAAGVPVPRASHAIVTFNNRDLGVYVLIEGWNKRFLRRHFSNVDGNFYEGGFKREINEGLEVKSGDHPEDTSRLLELARAARERNLESRWQRLQEALDVDRFLKMVALETMIAHWDGYSMNLNNYRVFHDLETDQLVFMPHGLDQMFGSRRMRPNEDVVVPRTDALVTASVLETPEGRREYLKVYSELFPRVYDVPALIQRVREWEAQLRPAFAESRRAAWSQNQFSHAVEALCQRMALRGQVIEQFVRAMSGVARFDESGVVRLAEWTENADYGKPALQRLQDSDGNELLHLDANSGSSVGSWRTAVLLEGGRYRFEGRAKASGVVTDPGDIRGGVGLRIIGGRLREKLVEDADWTPLTYEFTINDVIAQVVLVCELRAAQGEAWFDADSLRLVRVR